MLASRTIISASRSLSRASRLPEFRNDLFLILIGEHCCKAVCRSAEFGLIRRPDRLARSWNIHPEGFAPTGHGYRRIRLQKPGDLFAEFPHPYLNMSL
jgi:hypothetical protein